MKKLMSIVLLVTFIGACTNPGINEDTEIEIQVVDKDEIEETDI